MTVVMGRRGVRSSMVTDMDTVSHSHTGGFSDFQYSGHTMLAVLQLLAFLSYIAFAATILTVVDHQHLPLALLLPTVGVLVGTLWIIRHRLPVGRGRTVCSVLVLLLLLVPSVIGQLGFNVPFLLVAQALLVIDAGLWAGLAGNAIVALTGVGVLASRGQLGEALVTGVLVFILMTVGTALGLLMCRYEAVLAQQQVMIAERDGALARVGRQVILEKELVLAQERARAAHELHDGLGHRLTQIGMSLEFASRVKDVDGEAAWAEIAVAHQTAREAVGEMRTWVRALSPVTGEGEGGVRGLEAIAASFRGTGVEVHVEDLLCGRTLEQIDEVVIYRAVQEGLTNALRHSRTRHVSISLAAVRGGVEMRLVNSISPECRAGVPRAPVAEPGGPLAGFGISGLKARAHELGGSLQAGRQGDDFLLRLFLPDRFSDKGEQAGDHSRGEARG